MSKISELTALFTLFETVVRFIKLDDNSGNGYIVSENYQRYAELFEQWEKSDSGFLTERSENEGFISFSNGKRGVIFCDRPNHISRYRELGDSGDILVIIR